MRRCYVFVERGEDAGNQIVEFHRAILGSRTYVEVAIIRSIVSVFSRQTRHWFNRDSAPSVQVEQIGIADPKRMIGSRVNIKPSVIAKVLQNKPILSVL